MPDLVWIAAGDRRDETAEILRDSGAEVRERLGFEPLTVIAATAGVVALIRAIRSMAKDERYCGLVIDATKDPLEVREMPSWERRQVLVISSGGAEFHEFDDTGDLQALLERVS